MNNLPDNSFESIFFKQQQAFVENKSIAPADRIAMLERLKRLLLKNWAAIAAALHKDFKKPPAEAMLTELAPILQEIKHMKLVLRQFLGNEKVGVKFPFWGAKAFKTWQAKGVVLIISPWNYPVQLCIVPLIGAIAAGNRVIIKPSELTPNTSALLAQLLHSAFDSNHLAVVLGGADVAQNLLKLPFNHVFFTGSSRVGQLIQLQRASFLGTLTLELGGKSPVWVANNAVNAANAQKIIWGKCLNLGQTCIAPDYLICQKESEGSLVKHLTDAIQKLYPQQIANHFAAIITASHAQRLVHLVEDAIAKGAKLHGDWKFDIPERFISPVILTNVNWDMKLMQEEIFGPILPVICVENAERGIELIKQNASEPLAVYIFDAKKDALKYWMRNLNAGGFCQNDVLVHIAQQNLPFGGIGKSGTGQYHGQYSFETFARPVAGFQQARWSFNSFIYPPISNIKAKLIKLLTQFVS